MTRPIMEDDEACVRQRRSCLPRLTARRNRPNQFCESQSLSSNQNPSRPFRAVDKILDNSRQNFFAHVRDLSNECEVADNVSHASGRWFDTSIAHVLTAVLARSGLAFYLNVCPNTK